jgi:alpha-glucosidase
MQNNHKGCCELRKIFMKYREKLSFLLLLNLFGPLVNAAVTIESPDGTIKFRLECNQQNNLQYEIIFDNRSIVKPSSLGLVLDEVKFGQGCTIGTPENYNVNRKILWRGVKAEVADQCNGMRIPIIQNENSKKWTLEVRCFNDGVAFRYLVPVENKVKVKNETLDFNCSGDDAAWYTTRYEAHWSTKVKLSQMPSESHIVLPLTIELSNGGYGLIAEADNLRFTSMLLQNAGDGRLSVRLSDSFLTDQNIISPWRIMMLARDLNALVNNDIIASVSPPPDPNYFPDGINTSWIKPGRCLWQWWAYSGPGVTWNKQKDFVDAAEKLECAYYLVDEGWQNPKFGWITEQHDEYYALKELCEYAAAKNVGIFVWAAKNINEKRYWPGIENKGKIKDFMSKCAYAGVKGVKLDFINSDNHETLAWYKECLETAAKYKLMVNFHGSTKPAGEMITWPNEVTREDVSGLEQYKAGKIIPGIHFTALPFTRYVVGHGDFTPTTLTKNLTKGTTFSLQLSTAVLYTSPFLCWADRPEVFLTSQVTDIIRTMPYTWDETVVLPQSKIGVLAAFARRSGDKWYIAAINGDDKERSLEIPLTFLGDGACFGTLIEDKIEGDSPDLVRKDCVEFTKQDTLKVKMKVGGGFVGRFCKLGVEGGAGPFTGDLNVKLKVSDKKTKIAYTLDGTEPMKNSKIYDKPIKINDSTQIWMKAFGGEADGIELKTWFVLKK